MSKLLILTGMSGAGKTTAMLLFEELHFRCIENPPAELFSSLFELIHKESNDATTVVSVNLLNVTKALKIAKAIEGLTFEVVCLVASVQDLLSRYKLTRHLHPLQAEGYTLTRAIDLDLSLVESIKPSIDTLIDSSELSAKNFRQKLMSRFSSMQHKVLTVSFVTFGFKHGVPIDADTVLDVRVIPNPFYEPTLKSLSGLDEPVRTYVESQEAYQVLLQSAIQLIKNQLIYVIKEGRPSYEIAIGCTGGRHRSVVFAHALADALSTTLDIGVRVMHRDLEKMIEME
jgi:UPF0042 nucleotide-binding protein